DYAELPDLPYDRDRLARLLPFGILAGPPKEDKMVVHFAPAPPDAADPQAAFTAVQPVGNVTIPLSAA
ncbi:hypothetical protein ANCDUO_21236, partial [Ancylostoma duodenale]